jgi:hypothetical protein
MNGLMLQRMAVSEFMTSKVFRIARRRLDGGLESFAGGLDFTSEIVRMASEAEQMIQVWNR